MPLLHLKPEVSLVILDDVSSPEVPDPGHSANAGGSTKSECLWVWAHKCIVSESLGGFGV